MKVAADDAGTLDAVDKAFEAVKAATDPAGQHTALENARSLHLHLWANFAINRIRLYLAKVRDGGSKGQPVLVNMNWATSSWTTALTSEEMKGRVEEFKKAQEAAEDKEEEEAHKKGEEVAKKAEVPGWKTPAEEAAAEKKRKAEEEKKEKDEVAEKKLEAKEEKDEKKGKNQR